MARHEVRQGILGRPAHGDAPGAQSHRIDLIGLVGTVLLLLLGATAVTAETSNPTVSVESPLAAPNFLTLAAVGLLETVPTPTDAAPEPVVAEPDEIAPPMLEALLTIRPGPHRRSIPTTTDEALAAAVALGTNPDLEPKNPFRKRSRDLFRTERPVTIGRADMLLRLRLRAKTRRAMSVELRF